MEISTAQRYVKQEVIRRAEERNLGHGSEQPFAGGRPLLEIARGFSGIASALGLLHGIQCIQIPTFSSLKN